MIRRNASALEPVVGGPNGMSATEVFDPCTPRPREVGPFVPPSLERAIAARWTQWEPWVWIHLDPSPDGPESRRLRQRHSEQVLDLLRAGISMRTIRRHRLDDPRLTGELRAVLVQATKERQSKARFRRSEEQRKLDRLWRLIRLGPGAESTAAAGPKEELPQECSQAATAVVDSLAVPAAIQAIRQHVCEHFYMRERRDPELTVRTHRRAYVLPRQVAMYIARQLTGATLQEIGREFGHRHHTTVLHCIRKIEKLRCSDDAVDRAITQVMNAVGLRVV